MIDFGPLIVRTHFQVWEKKIKAEPTIKRVYPFSNWFVEGIKKIEPSK